jgi:hypothetical protein
MTDHQIASDSNRPPGKCAPTCASGAPTSRGHPVTSCPVSKIFSLGQRLLRGPDSQRGQSTKHRRAAEGEAPRAIRAGQPRTGCGQLGVQRVGPSWSAISFALRHEFQIDLFGVDKRPAPRTPGRRAYRRRCALQPSAGPITECEQERETQGMPTPSLCIFPVASATARIIQICGPRGCGCHAPLSARRRLSVPRSSWIPARARQL